MLKQWKATAAISAGVPFAIPASAFAPNFVGVRNLAAVPQASGVTTATIFETGVASGAGAGTSGAAGTGQVTADILAQQLAAGDAITANSVITVDIVTRDEVPYNG